MIAEWSTIAEGDAGIAQTLARMRALALAAAQDPRIVQTARAIVRHVDGHDRWDTTAALFGWFMDHYVYTLDPTGYELIVATAVMLAQLPRDGYLQGDCDDAVTLLSSLLEAVGVPTRYRVVAPTLPQGPGDSGYAHVFLEAETEPETWWPLDVTLTGARPGDRPPRQPSEAIYDATGFRGEGRPMIRRKGVGQFDFDFGVTADAGLDLWGGASGSVLDAGSGAFDLGVSPVLADPFIDLGSGYIGSPVTASLPSAGISAGTNWGKIFADVSGAVIKLGTATLPLAERYGVLTPAPGSVPLQYPGETSQQYAARVAAGGFGNIFATTPTSTWLLLGGGALLLVMLMRRK